MKRKFLGRVSAVAMASAMMVSMFGMSVSAAGEPPKNVEIKKQINKEDNIYTPSTTFNFTVSKATDEDLRGSEKVLVAVNEIPENGVTMEDNSITSDVGHVNETAVILSDTAKLSVNKSAFTKPGIYRYVVSETTGNYPGMSYTMEKKYFDVYVNSDLEVYSYMFVDEDDEQDGKDDGIFENDYGVGEADKLYDLTIKKEVTGNQGDKSQDFEFAVTVTGEQNEQYYVVYSDGKPAVTLKSGEEAKIYLSDSETATIYGLDSDDTYSIVETSYAGYTTTNDSSKTATNNASGTLSADKMITYTNDKEVSTPTGIIMNIAPYIVLVAFAAVAALFFLRRRNNREF